MSFIFIGRQVVIFGTQQSSYVQYLVRNGLLVENVALAG
jgi:hypothetical protein